jgi:CRISPR-associated protein Csx3
MRLLQFEIPGGTCTPDEFAQMVRGVEKQLAGPLPVLLNGRGPVWGYGMLIHAAHPTPAIATYDPRLAGYVVVASHDSHYALGAIIPGPEAE